MMNSPCTVLIVEDHAAVLASLVDWLLAHFPTCRPALAASAEEALEMAGVAKPDLVLMDVGLPGTDGITATAILTAIMPEVPVVILSAQESRAHQDAAARAGAAGYVFKRELAGTLALLLAGLLPAAAGSR
jgi:DNA-binding NarL/FixJ family response regulator